MRKFGASYWTLTEFPYSQFHYPTKIRRESEV